MMADDLTKPSDEAVLTLIGKENPDFTPGFWPHVNLGAPAVDVGNRNTSMTIVGKPGSGLVGAQMTVRFNRVDLGVLDVTDYTPGIIPVGSSVYAFTHVLIDSIGMQLGPNDVEETFVVEEDESEDYNTLQLTAKAGSRGYIGSHKLKIARPPHISTVFTSSVLPGF